MATENPFPLNITDKIDSWEKVQLMANVDPDYKYTAEEFNLLLQALKYLYENQTSTAQPSTTPAEQLIYFGAGAIALTPPGQNTTPAEYAAHINAVGFTITAGVSVMFDITGRETINGVATMVKKRFRFARNNQEGTHGTGSTHGPITNLDLIANGYSQVVSGISPGVNNHYIDLGNLGATPIHTYINGLDPSTVSWENLLAGHEYYFSCTINGDGQIYQYVGTLPKTVGAGNTAVNVGDFDLISSSGQIPTPDNIETIRAWATPPEEDVEVGVTKYLFTATEAFELKSAKITVMVVPTGTSLKATMYKNGSAITPSSGSIEIAVANTVSSEASYTEVFAIGDVVGIRVTQAGSVNAGQGIIVKLNIKK